MYIECFTNNGKPYLRLVQSVRVTRSDGRKIPRKQVVLNIGPVSKFDDGEADFVERLKKSFKAGRPLIPSLQKYCDDKDLSEVYKFTINEGSTDCFGHPRLFSHVLIERIMEELGLMNLFSTYKAMSKIEYDIYGFARLLIFGRVLNPDSKCATVKQNDDYYEAVLKDFNPDNVYDALTFIAENKDRIVRRINTNLVKKAHRSPEIIYYDVTNFYFETEDPDEDIFDEEGNVLVKGLRKMGVSKEERKLPIVQMGLFMDDMGIPISVETFPGNTLDHLTLRPALKNSIDDLEFSRFIMIADRGICQYRNLLHLLDAGNGYIVSKSLLKSTKAERQWAYDDEGYISVSSDFKYKSRIVKRTVKDETGNSRTIEEKVIVYWSRRFQQRSEKENKGFLDFLKKLEGSPESFRITALESKSLRRFFKKDYVNIKTGELLTSADIKPMIDPDLVEAYKREMGYYQIISSELTMSESEIIEKYHGLTQIEEQFHAMKGELSARPVYVRTPDHIKAHLLICTIALIIIRIIQRRILDSGLPDKKEDHYWSTGLSGKRIQKALNKWKVDPLPGDLYRFNDLDDPDLALILKAFNIEIPAKFYRKAQLKAIKSSIEIFM